jgi:hypothetical protein
MDKPVLKTLRHCRTKGELQDLYFNQMARRYITNEINEIIQKNRDLPKGHVIQCKVISTKEFLLFVKENGVPDGYILSEELQLKLSEL